jgi:hypothetical protein
MGAMAVYGLMNSFLHPDNGMTKADMEACKAVANATGEVIIFRSTGSWSLRWIEQGYPTKNFHVKGKSSDWGPQAGFVPRDGKYSKVGADGTKAADGTAANQEGLDHHYAGEVQLKLTRAELQKQIEIRAGSPRKLAISSSTPIPKSEDLRLLALRTGDNKEFYFRAVWSTADNAFQIYVYDESRNAFLVRDASGPFGDKERAVTKPLMVMTSSEVGANNRPMTGDYDLMAVCPRWNDLHATTPAAISKPAVNFGPDRKTVGLTFASGSNLDKVMDMRSNTGAKGGTRTIGDKTLNSTFQGLTKRDGGKLEEHGDMGNVTGRILRCINALNAAMPNGASAMRRVHHNAESHRNHIFGAISGSEMEGGDGVPLTVFQPAGLLKAGSPVAQYGDVATLETLTEFRNYASSLHQAGYFVPRNWTWGMSIRDRVASGEFANLEAGGFGRQR